MKARLPMNLLQKKVAAEAAAALYDKMQFDTSRRAQYLWMIAMLNVGLSPRTVRRTMEELENRVTPAYAELKTDDVADYAVKRVLEKHGFEVDEMVKEQ